MLAHVFEVTSTHAGISAHVYRTDDWARHRHDIDSKQTVGSYGLAFFHLLSSPCQRRRKHLKFCEVSTSQTFTRSIDCLRQAACRHLPRTLSMLYTSWYVCNLIQYSLLPKTSERLRDCVKLSLQRRRSTLILKMPRSST